MVQLPSRRSPTMSMNLQEKMDRVRHLLAAKLSSIYKRWAVEGESVMGPGTLAVRVEDQHHQASASHLDIGFVLNRESNECPVLWDCVSGLGATSDEALERAVETWAVSTLPVFLELVNLDGSFADHYHSSDPEGCPGWHVIHGPWIAFGVGAAPDELQTWALQNPVLPTIGPLTIEAFERPVLNCVKMLFGCKDADIAEVRVNGLCTQNASERLKALAWPRSHDPAFARCFWLFVHGE